MTIRARMTDAERHANHHRLINERADAYRAMSKARAGLARYRRREALKSAWFTTRSHLTSEHGRRGLSAMISLDDLLTLHDQLHQGATE